MSEGTSSRGPSRRLQILGLTLGLLGSADLLETDPAREAGYYACADALIARIVATPAADFMGAQIKAEAIAWCCASRTDFALGETSEQVLIGSLLRDLLAR